MLLAGLRFLAIAIILALAGAAQADPWADASEDARVLDITQTPVPDPSTLSLLMLGLLLWPRRR